MTHVTQLNAAAKPPHSLPVKRRAFTSLENADFRAFFLAATMVMMADNIEHVISYWVIFQKFHSPALAGFAVVSHWVPYLLFAGFTGRLADRFGTRRLIMTDSTAMWKAMVLLIVHGLAGVLWVLASQVMIYEMVRVDELPSAVRIFATGRYLGFVAGPAVGAGLLLACGSSLGMLINALIYAPLFLWLVYSSYGSRVPPGQAYSIPRFSRFGIGVDVSAKRISW